MHDLKYILQLLNNVLWILNSYVTSETCRVHPQELANPQRIIPFMLVLYLELVVQNMTQHSYCFSELNTGNFSLGFHFRCIEYPLILNITPRRMTSEIFVEA